MQEEENLFSTWDSPITVECIASAKKLGEILWDDQTESLFWSETFEKKVKIFSYQYSSGKTTRHKAIKKVGGSIGYGGGGWTSGHGCIFYGESSRLFRYDLIAREKKKLLTKNGGIATPSLSPCGQWVAYIHQNEDEFDCIGIVDAEGKEWPFKLSEGFDFYTQFRWAPCGKKVTFVAWNQPHMPWMNSAVYMADFIVSHGKPMLENIKKISSDSEQAVFQPEFSQCGSFLYFMSDVGGWSQLYRFDLNQQSIQQCGHIEGECAQPNWVQQMTSWCLSNDDRFAFIISSYQSEMKLFRLDLSTFQSQVVRTLEGWSEFNHIISAKKLPIICLNATSYNQGPTALIYNYEQDKVVEVVNTTPDINSEYYSKPDFLEWKTKDGTNISGVYWPPHSPKQTGQTGSKPPVIVKAHVGPTAQCRVHWDLQSQFFTSRGIGILAVNFRGSTGFGRSFMKSLNGYYGVYDVEDVVSGAENLIAKGIADKSRILIMGSSSGGYTVFQAMTDYPEFFAGGISAYGITDLLSLGENTHKFEKFYNDILVAPLPQGKNVLRQRSPLSKVDKVLRPLAIFQGDQDVVVPPAQAQDFVDALKEKQIPHVYKLYEGEGHGFRKLETRQHYYEAVIGFIRNVIKG